MRPFSSRAGRSDTHSTVSSRNCRRSRSQASEPAATACSRARMLSNHSQARRASAASAQASHIGMLRRVVSGRSHHPYMPSAMPDYNGLPAEITKFLNDAYSPPLLVTARDPFGDENRLRLAFPLDGDVPRHLHARVDILDGGEPEARTHARAGRNGAGEANAVQAVVDPQARALDLDRLPEQMRQKREREKTVRHGRTVGRFPCGALAVDVDPLMVLRRAGKSVDALLAHGEPIGHRDLLANEPPQLFDAELDLGHVLEAPGECFAATGTGASERRAGASASSSS